MISKNLEDYRKNARTRLQTLRMRIDVLEKQAGKAKADVEVRNYQKLDQVRGQYAQVKEKLDELGKAKEEVWSNQKPELERAITALSDALDQVTRQISV